MSYSSSNMTVIAIHTGNSTTDYSECSREHGVKKRDVHDPCSRTIVSEYADRKRLKNVSNYVLVRKTVRHSLRKLS